MIDPIRIPESPAAAAFLQALMCRKHKGSDIEAARLHPWNRRETEKQAAFVKPLPAELRAA